MYILGRISNTNIQIWFTLCFNRLIAIFREIRHKRDEFSKLLVLRKSENTDFAIPILTLVLRRNTYIGIAPQYAFGARLPPELESPISRLERTTANFWTLPFLSYDPQFTFFEKKTAISKLKKNEISGWANMTPLGRIDKFFIPPINPKIGQKLPLTYLGKVKKFFDFCLINWNFEIEIKKLKI